MRRLSLVALAALAVGATGCAKRDTVVVGSKDFTEQILLGEIVAQQLEARGVPVERRFNLGGTFICHQAIVSGALDIYVEYSGTAWTAILDEPPPAEVSTLTERLRERYPKDLGLVWGATLGFDNSFALIMRPELSDRWDVHAISELREHQDTLRFAAGHEFLERGDGYLGLMEAYELELAHEPIATGFGLMYQALREEKVDLIAASATDGLIDALGLRVLADDRGFFLPYEASLVYRPELADAHPELVDAEHALAGSLSREVMRELNRRVDEGEDPAVVAREFLTSERAMGPSARVR